MGKVIVRYWNTSIIRGGIGHVSLETCHDDNSPGIYISFWPKNPDVEYEYPLDKKNRYEIKQSEDGNSYLRTRYYDDEIGEGRTYDFKTKLYCLDLIEIEKAFEEFKNSDFCWSILGSSYFAKEKNQNCSGLVYSLLDRGGIAKFLSFFTKIKLDMKKYAPTPWGAVLGTAPFAFLLAFEVAKGGKLFDKGTKGCIEVAKEFDAKYPCSPDISDNDLLERAKHFDECYPELAGFYQACPASHLQSLMALPEIVLKFAPTFNFNGNVGLSISLAAVVISGIYISAFLTGSLATALVITPADVDAMVKEVAKSNGAYLTIAHQSPLIIDEEYQNLSLMIMR